MTGTAGKSFEKSKAALIRELTNDRMPPHAAGTHNAVTALQRMAGNRAVTSLLASSSGRPLDPTARREMSSRFGHDFSTVRIHTDERAAEAATLLRAKAFTYGRDIVFNSNRFAPQRSDGKTLLAHELAHVVQQSRGAATASEPASETDARQSAAGAAAGRQVSVQGAAAPGAQCNSLSDEELQQRLAENEQEAGNATSQENLEALYQERQALMGQGGGAGTTSPAPLEKLSDSDLAARISASRWSLMNDLVENDRKLADAERIKQEDEKANLELETGGDPQQMRLAQMVEADNAQIAREKAERERQQAAPVEPSAPKPKPAPPSEEQTAGKLQSQLGVTRDQLNELALGLGQGPISMAELRRQLTEKGRIGDASRPGPHPLAEPQVAIDYAGRVGTEEDLARREMAARVEALGQGTTIGGIAAAYAGAFGGNAEEMQKWGALGNTAESFGAGVGGFQKGSATRAVSGLLENQRGPDEVSLVKSRAEESVGETRQDLDTAQTLTGLAQSGGAAGEARADTEGVNESLENKPTRDEVSLVEPTAEEQATPSGPIDASELRTPNISGVNQAPATDGVPSNQPPPALTDKSTQKATSSDKPDIALTSPLRQPPQVQSQPMRKSSTPRSGYTATEHTISRNLMPNAKIIKMRPGSLAGRIAPGTSEQELMDQATTARDEATSQWLERPRSRQQKTVSVGGSGATAVSGRSASSKGVSPADVATQAEKIGHTLQPHGRDPKGQPGQYHAQHAEKKVAEPATGVSRDQCEDCIGHFQKMAADQKRDYVVADPQCKRVFQPDGTYTEYWQDGTIVRYRADGKVSVLPAENAKPAAPNTSTSR